jgi:iron complex transport system substrate-binding protein
MAGEKKERPGGAVKFIVIFVALMAILVGAIEWTRQARAPETPTAVAENQAAKPFPRELRDAAGQHLVIASRPTRIVSQTLATDEILLSLCPPERIVALSGLAGDENYSNVVVEARRVAGRTSQGAEQILRLQPDLVFVASYSRAETVELLKASRAAVFRFTNFNSITEIKGNIRAVGYAIGSDAEAETLVKKMDEALAAVRARVPAGRPPARLMSFGESGYTAGANTVFDDMVRAAGAVNVSAENGIDGVARVSNEKIIEWQPDFIVAGANHGEMETVRKSLLADPVIAASKAGRDGKIIILDNRHFLTVSQYVVRGVEDLADALYGKRK